MANRSINYMARTFDDFRSELINFSKKYYPELTNSLGDSSVGQWFIDLVSAVGDDLSYYIDRAQNEQNINTASMKSSVMNMARINGLKVPGQKASVCEVELSCVLDVDSTNIAQPDFKYAPLVRKGSIVSSGNYQFELNEDVNFAEQFNDNAFSNRRFIPNRDSNGGVISYTVTKSVIASAGVSRVYKKVISESELTPFMEVILPEKDIMNVESIIFKETADFRDDPSVSEYYFDEEVYQIKNQAVKTHRYFEVESLCDQYRFGNETKIDNGVINEIYNPYMYDDYTETSSGNTKTTRIYRGKWKPITQKFITEYTDNGYLKVIFGSGVEYEEYPDNQTKYADYRMGKIINNGMMGILPEAGWTMFVLYRVGGGASSNIAQGAINNVTYLNMEFPNDDATDSEKKGRILNSITVNNVSTAIAGKDEPSVDEIRYMIKYNSSSQNRCVTLKDYKIKVMQMPPKYGTPFRANAVEENNKIILSTLGIDQYGNLNSYLPNTLINNIQEWLSHYKNINDYIEIRSGKIYNIGFGVDLFVDKNYNVADVVNNVIATIKSYMDINSHDMGDDIFIADLEKEINMVDGVIALIDLRVYNIYSGTYSSDVCPLPTYNKENSSCYVGEAEEYKISDNGAKIKRIDIDETDYVLYGEYNSMYEVLNDNDINVKVKLK